MGDKPFAFAFFGLLLIISCGLLCQISDLGDGSGSLIIDLDSYLTKLVRNSIVFAFAG